MSRGRPNKDDSDKLKPRFTVSLKDSDWLDLKNSTDKISDFARKAIIEKITREREA